MRWTISLLIHVLWVLEAKSDIYNGMGYHVAVGIPKAFKLMSEEGFVARIVGGIEVTSATLYPYQTFFHHAGIIITLTSGQTSLCGGALVSNTRVLTAAHCWWDGHVQARQFTIVLGSVKIFSGGTRLTTSDVIVHPKWNTEDITHDIAIVKMSRVSYSSSVQAIPVPPTSDASQSFAGVAAVATGYGKTSDAQSGFPSTTSLHHINLKIITNAVCQGQFDIDIHSSHLCTAGGRNIGTCEGDSGGPLTVMWKGKRILVGIVSFGLADGCQAGYPSVYTRVTSFLTWIQANL